METVWTYLLTASLTECGPVCMYDCIADQVAGGESSIRNCKSQVERHL